MLWTFVTIVDRVTIHECGCDAEILHTLYGDKQKLGLYKDTDDKSLYKKYGR